MSDRISLYRHLEIRRGGMKDNRGGPVVTVEARNMSGGAIAYGDVVTLDTTNTTPDSICVTTTTTANDRLVIGMTYDTTIAASAYGRIQIWGPTDSLKADGTTDIAVGDMLGTYTSAKIAAKTTGKGAFARSLEAYTADSSSGVLDAFIFGGFAVPAGT